MSAPAQPEALGGTVARIAGELRTRTDLTLAVKHIDTAGPDVNFASAAHLFVEFHQLLI
jgi:hypothetical protein